MRSFLSMARLPWSVQALLGCGVFLVVGVVVVDDYGVGWDARDQRAIVQRNLAFIVGDIDRLDGFSPAESNKYYGVAFELPLLLLERGLGLEDPRSIYLLQHLVTHGFFLIGGLCGSLLVYRLSGSRVVGAFTLLMFLMQPRLYAHSFFNSKDLPFLSMFMVSLYVTHRAFRTETVGAFVLGGVCVGILTNLRIMGAMLFPAVLVLRGLDLGQARRGERPHVLMTAAVFAVAGPCTLYALSPYLWANPFAFVTAWQALAYQPMRPLDMLFQGQVVDPHQPPWHYIPMWMAISTPLVTLLCGGLGGIGVCLRSVRHPRTALGNTDLRFGLLLVACLTLPVLAIIVLGAYIYDEWRHVFFLHAPLCGLAGLGLAWVGRIHRQAAVGVAALAGLGMLVTGWEMVRLHPHQQVYFNELVDRTTPEYLHDHYVLDVWRNSCREGLEFLRRRYPATTVYVRNSRPVHLGWENLPSADRARLGLVLPDDGPDFAVLCGRDLQNATENPSVENTVYTRKVYNNTLLTVTAQVTVPDAALKMARRFYDDGYRKITSGRLVQQATFDMYTYPGGRILGYARDECTASDMQARFFVHVFPVDEQELPARRRRYGFDNRDFNFFDWGKQEAGRCWTTVALPAYEIGRIHTGQYTGRGKLWETTLVEPIYTPLTMR